jgi:hypothetical protein
MILNCNELLQLQVQGFPGIHDQLQLHTCIASAAFVRIFSKDFRLAV